MRRVTFSYSSLNGGSKCSYLSYFADAYFVIKLQRGCCKLMVISGLQTVNVKLSLGQAEELQHNGREETETTSLDQSTARTRLPSTDRGLCAAAS